LENNSMLFAVCEATKYLHFFHVKLFYIYRRLSYRIVSYHWDFDVIG